ncbi:MAG TPA: branched-chain amino acid ABC transporter substrate-binding protein [Phototrophicaceae bacterium]|nr:branched-chain amino acid ABC transporter substrate-binding protein [Phototrophicaceae bacterium]
MRAKKVSLIVSVVAAATMMSASLAAHAQAAKIIKIASQSPLSGGQSVDGTGLRNGADLAISQLAQPLTDMGFQVQLVPYDDKADPDTGVANAQQIVADPAILAVVGHFNSGVAIPSSVVYDANNLVMVSPANTNPAVTDRGLKTVNRVCGRDDAQGAVGAEFAQSLGIKSVYIINDTTVYGAGVANFFQKTAESLGITVLGNQGTTETSNFDGIIQPILALNPDAVYMGGIYDQMGIFANQLSAAGFTGTLLGPDGLDAPDYAKLAGTAATQTYYSSAAGPASAYPGTAQFIKDYTAKYGNAPTPYAAESYDAAGIILQALETTIKADNGNLPTRAEVAAAVRATQDYSGLTGSISFDANGDRAEANYFVLKVNSSDPAQWTSNTILKEVQIPSPLTAAASATAEATMEMTPEATAGS